MTAALGLVGWLLVGGFVASRGEREAWERALAFFFWPFFLVPAPQPPGGGGPLVRLRDALPPDDPAVGVMDQLEQAVAAQQGRLDRLTHALQQTDVPRSRERIAEALEREQQGLSAGLAAIEDAATHLWLMREQGRPAEIGRLLQGLADRISAGEEISSIEQAP